MRAIVQKVLLFVVVALVVLAGPSMARAQVNPRLVREIRGELVTLPYYGVFDWLQFEVQPNGTVVLRGQVVRPTTKSDAGGRVKEIEGVKSVDNQIEVLPLSPNDDRLRVAVQAGDRLPERHELRLESRITDRDLVRGETKGRRGARALVGAHAFLILVARSRRRRAGRAARRRSTLPRFPGPRTGSAAFQARADAEALYWEP